jgi:selenium-binding protein 1
MKMLNLIFVLLFSVFMVACNQEQPTTSINSANSAEFQNQAESVEFNSIDLYNSMGFVHGFVIELDGDDYYMAGAPDGPNGEIDVPGHYWVQAGPNQVVGKHYNTGPFGAAQWWSSDAPNGELLYIVKGIIDTWSLAKASSYASKGYMHYHEFVKVSDGTHHPTKVVWFKHTARTTFTLDRGPRPDLTHAVTPGIDYEFIPNGNMPYSP